MRLPLFAAALLLSAPAFAASFDCARAATPIEKMICADPEASRLDEELNAAYQQALDKTGGLGAIRRWQRNWLKSPALKSCADATCLRAAQTARAALLRQVAALSSPAGAYTGYYVRHRGLHVDRHYADMLLVGLEDGRVLVAGSAIWLGPRADEGQVNTGEVEGFANAGGKALEFADDACKVTMRVDSAGLAVEDNHHCGGVNVTFTGAYRRMIKP